MTDFKQKQPAISGHTIRLTCLFFLGAVLVVLHGVLLPWYASRVRLQPGTRYLVPGSRMAIQWHQDARLEMDIAAYPFPQSLASRARQRCDRPMYGFVGHLMASAIAELLPAAARDPDLYYRLGG